MVSNYFKMPYALFLNEKYRELTNNDKIIYAILYNRFEISSTNPDFRDGDGVFCYYTVDKLGEWLKMSKPTIVNGLKRLEEHGLIDRVKQSQGRPDKIHVREAQVKHTVTLSKYTICETYPNIEKYANDEEIKRLQKILDALTFSNKDSYKINGEYVSTRRILSKILTLDTGDIARVFDKVRNAPKISNNFFYLMTSLYNYAVEKNAYNP